MKFHCLFEQSGTFKNEFKKLGYEAYDYDILNEFEQTDYQINLFDEIEQAYLGNKSIFDNISKDDYILAFFPCVRFENQIMLHFRGQAKQLQKLSLEQKMEYDMKLQAELTQNYNLVNKMFIICIRKGLKLIMENPFSEEHYLRRYWCLLPKVIDRDRTIRGDYFKKPTQYWFLNCEPTFRPLFESQIWQKEKKIISQVHSKTERSLISKDYANRFIREFIL